nr:hypothetical protein [uncultured Sphingomonas sp.]
MAKMDWEAAKLRRGPTPLLTRGMIKEYRQDAEHFAKRVAKKKGQRESGTGRVLGEEEKAAIAQKMGWAIAVPRATTTDSTDYNDVPWWSDEELAAGKNGIAPDYETSETSPSRRDSRPHSRRQRKRGHSK